MRSPVRSVKESDEMSTAQLQSRSEIGARHAELPLISADSHAIELGKRWIERAEREYHDGVPRIISRNDGDFCPYGNGETAAFAGFAATGSWRGHRSSITRMADLRPAILEPLPRLQEAQQDGVGPEVPHRRGAMRLGGIEGAGLYFVTMLGY